MITIKVDDDGMKALLHAFTHLEEAHQGELHDYEKKLWRTIKMKWLRYCEPTIKPSI